MKEKDNSSKRPNTPELIYGQEQYERGYAAGYFKHQCDMRRIREAKERTILSRFKDYMDYLEDGFAANRKR